MTIDDLIQEIQKNELSIDVEMVRLAYDYAAEAHQNQLRFNGQKYIEHPLRTAQILVDLKMDQATVIAGLLHDVPEDTTKTLRDIQENFGEEVAILVDGITKLGKLKYRGVERYIENLRKMFVSMASDIRTVIIKFADRLNNLETLDALPERKRLRIAQETLEIYSPIAQRLGIGVLRTALEDEAFRYADPKAYKMVKDLIVDHKNSLLRTLSTVKERLIAELEQNHIQVIDCHGRAKGLYSLYSKLKRYDNDVSQIYDLVALRLVVPSITDCYAALGVVHAVYRPLKGRIKDYIAQPKPNHYRSLHTTIFADYGGIIEIQIRDPQMHEEAEYGIASHWHYHQFGSHKIPDEYLDWVKELAKWHKNKQNTSDYLKSLKIEVFQNRIFVFTPQGDIIDLPENSTPIDFAYHIHTEVGNRATTAKVNDEIAPLDAILKSGDIVEIVTDKARKGPNYDWLRFVKTQSARAKIRQYAKPHLWQRLKRW